MNSKFNNEADREIVLMLWRHYMLQSLHDYIKKLCSGNKSFKEANLIIEGFVSISKYWDDDLHVYFKQFSGVYQYIYSMLFPLN